MLLLPLLVLVADPPSLLAAATTRLSTACREAACAEPRRSPYRIQANGPAEDRGLKARAVTDDGARCQVIGARMCTRAPRTWLEADLNP